MVKSLYPFSASHNKGLDGLRGVLSLIVVITHSWSIYVYPMQFSGIWDGFETVSSLAGRAAVLSFFALSGFVMALSTHKNLQRNSGFRLREFAVSRLVRIGPPLCAALLLGWGLEYWLRSAGLAVFPRTDIHLDRPNFLFNFHEIFSSLLSLGLKGDLTGGVNGPLWSLRFELQCYILCGLGSYVAFSSSGIWRRMAALVLLGYYARRIHFTFNLDLICFSAFLFGWIAYWNQNKLTVARVFPVICLFLIPWFAALRLTDWRILNPYEEQDTNFWMQLNQVGLGLLVALALVPLQRSLLLSRLKFIGDFSYTLYITHYLVLLAAAFVVFSHFQAISFPMALILFVGMIFVSMLVAALLAFVVESPAALRYKDNFITKMWHRFFPARNVDAETTG